jgi:hypothetical protein
MAGDHDVSQTPMTEKSGQSTNGRSTWTVQLSTVGVAAAAGAALTSSAALAIASAAARWFDDQNTVLSLRSSVLSARSTEGRNAMRP